MIASNLNHTFKLSCFYIPAVLLYRICRCFRRIYVKLLHAIFHALAFPCIVIGFLAVLDYHNKKGINNFYSLHSWIGLTAMGLFGIQVRSSFVFVNTSLYKIKVSLTPLLFLKVDSTSILNKEINKKTIICIFTLINKRAKHPWSQIKSTVTATILNLPPQLSTSHTGIWRFVMQTQFSYYQLSRTEEYLISSPSLPSRTEFMEKRTLNPFQQNL